MGHLKKGASGHLLKAVNGHLALDCESGAEPSTDCSDCAENCDGAATMTATVSGALDIPNGAWEMLYNESCSWYHNFGEWATLALFCGNGGWTIYYTGGGDCGIIGDCIACLVCSGDHPTGVFEISSGGTIVFS